MTAYDIVKRARGYTLQVFAVYPEEGPLGTPGRGPYCVRWIPLKNKAEKAGALKALEEQSIPHVDQYR